MSFLTLTKNITMKNQATSDRVKQTEKLKDLKARAEQLLIDIEAETNTEASIKLISKYNALLAKVETQENYLDGTNKKQSYKAKLMKLNNQGGNKKRMEM